MKFPKLTIVIATYNSERTLKKCLATIRFQDYPQKDVEIILVDAGSTDRTLAIGKTYGCQIIQKPNVGAEAAKSYGLQEAKGELVADFGSDNILPHKKWLKSLVQPFSENSGIIASYPQYYHYRASDTIFNHYVSLFGANDPVPFYLGKADRQSSLFDTDKYSLAGETKDCGSYYEVTFTPENLPTVGANGFIIKKEILRRALVDPEHYFHIDVIFDLVCQGYNKFAVVKTSIIHDTADTLFSLLKKRGHYLSALYLSKLSKRRYHIVTKRDYGKLLFFIFFSLTFIQPLLVSLVGYLKKRDLAWFIHPLFCFLITLVYTKEFIKKWAREIL